MKILLISPCHKDFGGWYRARNISQALTRLNHNVNLIYNKRHYRNLPIRLLIGLKNVLRVVFDNSDVVHVFELVQPETLFPALVSKLFLKKVVVDLGDDWLHSPTFKRSGPLLKFFINILCKHLPKIFDNFTVTSDFLADLYTKKNVLKLINGVNTREFEPLSQTFCRSALKYSQSDKIVLSFGNTYGGDRSRLLLETISELNRLDPSIHIIINRRLNKKELPLFVGACDVILFPTGDNPCERACFPIRVGTYLNGEKVIATDTSPTEFHETLKPYKCLIQSRTPKLLARRIVWFLKDPKLRNKLEYNVKVAKKDLDWDILIHNLEDFYDNII